MAVVAAAVDHEVQTLSQLVRVLQSFEEYYGDFPVVVTVSQSPYRVEEVSGAVVIQNDGPHELDDCVRITTGDKFN